MQRSLTVVVVTVAMLAGFWLALAATAGAQAEPEETTVTMLEPEPGEEPGTVVLTARLNIEESGYPLGSRPIEFIVDASFFVDRPLIIEAVTDGSGNASVVYAVAWEGEHEITARFPGDETYLPSEASGITLDSAETGIQTGGVRTAGEGPQSLAPLSDWALWSVGVAWVGLLAVFAFVMARVAWTIRREEHPYVAHEPQPAAASTLQRAPATDGDQ